MPMDHIALAGTDSGATNRRKAWEALGKWVNSRLSRQRGVNFPSFFQIVWKMMATDETGSKLRRPVFALSERFSENFGVKQAGVRERGLPAPAAGDDLSGGLLAGDVLGTQLVQCGLDVGGHWLGRAWPARKQSRF